LKQVYNSRGFCQVSKACNRRRASYSNQISNPSYTEQCICDALTTHVGCVCQHGHTAQRGRKQKIGVVSDWRFRRSST